MGSTLLFGFGRTVRECLDQNVTHRIVHGVAETNGAEYRPRQHELPQRNNLLVRKFFDKEHIFKGVGKPNHAIVETGDEYGWPRSPDHGCGRL